MKTPHENPLAAALRIVVSLVLGMTALIVFFVAASAFEVRGANSTLRETVAGCIFGAPYLAFCQFWVAPKGIRGPRAKWPALAAMVAPLFAILPFVDRGAILPQGFPMAVSGCVGSLLGAVVAGRVGTRPLFESPSTDGLGRVRSCRRLLLAGAVLLVAAAPLVALGVVPPLLADLTYTTGFRPRLAAELLGVAAALNLLVAALIAFFALRPRDRCSGGYLGVPAVMALLLALLYAFSSGIRSQNPALSTASVVLVICAICDLVAAGLVTAASVVAERVGARPYPERQPAT